MMLRKRVWMLLLCLAPVAGFATEPYVAIEQRLTAEQRKATGLDTLTAEQLALLNRLLSEDRAQAVQAASAAATVAATQAAEAQAAAQATTAAAAQAPAPREMDTSRYLGLDQKPITSRVKGTVSGWQPGTEFALENGQVWKVLKGSRTLDEPLDSPEIVVVPGLAGRWFLQVHEDWPKARVYRID
jgi:biotin carboxyl carrier protein